MALAQPLVAAAAARALVSAASAAGPGRRTARVVFDLVLLGKGRSEAPLSFLGPEAGKAAMVAAERRIARIVAGRLRS